MSTTARNTRTANGGSTPRVTTAPTTRTTNRAPTRTSTSRRGTKTVHVCYDQNMQQIKCPKRSLAGGKLGGIIAGVVVGVVILALVLFWLYKRRKAKRARAVDGGETPPEPEKPADAPLAYTHSADVNNAPAMGYDTAAPSTGYQPPANSYNPPPESYQPNPPPASYQPNPPVQTAYDQAGGYAPHTLETPGPGQGYTAGYDQNTYPNPNYQGR